VKLLFDQNISPKITARLGEPFAESRQVVQVNLQNASDSVIFEFAKTHSFAIVTFDSDFVDLAVLKGTPPKIVWLRTGNLTTRFIADILVQNESSIRNFLESKEAGILEILK